MLKYELFDGLYSMYAERTTDSYWFRKHKRMFVVYVGFNGDQENLERVKFLHGLWSQQVLW